VAQLPFRAMPEFLWTGFPPRLASAASIPRRESMGDHTPVIFLLTVWFQSVKIGPLG
jgi:hypothetical protein